MGELMLAQEMRRSNAEVRAELYVVYAEIYVEKESHLVAYPRNAGSHPEPCEWCDRFGQRMAGVKMALRHFGGNPRVIPKQASRRRGRRQRKEPPIVLSCPGRSLRTRRLSPGRPLLSRRRRRQGLDNKVPIREHDSQLQLTSKGADVLSQRAQQKV